jgi:15-cis-phytoene synthase
MKIAARIIALAAALELARAFAPLSRTRSAPLAPTATTFYSLAQERQSGSNTSFNNIEQHEELLHAASIPPEATNGEHSGRLLEGGAVMDYSSVRASFKAEAALAMARQALLLNGDVTPPTMGPIGSILGINEQVIAEVGHPLGTIATPQEVQDCAAYLRSIAPAGLIEARVNTNDATPQPSFSPQQIARFREILAAAYNESGEVTGAFAKTFYMGTMLMGEAARKAIWAVYVWCRRTDEIVDAPRENDSDMLRDLSWWELRLENLWQYGEVDDVYDLCLLDCRVQYPNMDITPFRDMIRGMLMDVPDLGQDRYDGFEELHMYCYRVAGTVGLMSLPIFGCASGYNDVSARYVHKVICSWCGDSDITMICNLNAREEESYSSFSKHIGNQLCRWELHSSSPIFFAMLVKMLCNADVSIYRRRVCKGSASQRIKSFNNT